MLIVVIVIIIIIIIILILILIIIIIKLSPGGCHHPGLRWFLGESCLKENIMQKSRGIKLLLGVRNKYIVLQAHID